jgi:4,5-dihydroxyphthalate decarboxylase
MSRNPRTAAILDGRCTPVGIDLAISELQPPDVFWRQLRFGDFDVSEMSLSLALMMADRGIDEWTVLPVFHDRRFFQTFAFVSRQANIERPEDLRGKRVGVPDYPQTAALWTRAILQHHFGVLPSDMVWYMERTKELSCFGGAVDFKPPADVDMRYVPQDRNIGHMLVDGELDATLVYEPALLTGATIADRSPQHLPEQAVTGLFADAQAERRRCYESFGYVPANHCVVVRTSVLKTYPWVALNLYELFVKSRQLDIDAVHRSLALHAQLGLVDCLGEPGAFEPDFVTYGVRANQPLLDDVARFSMEQGLTSRQVTPGEFIAESCLSL